MVDKIFDFIKQSNSQGNLFVLKGYPVEIFCGERIMLANTIDNKIRRLLQLTQQEQQLISFDEFVCLYDLIVAQYRKIYIIENSVYHILYPINVNLDEHITSALLNHFNEDADENCSIDGLTEYTNIYGNFTKTEQGIACRYNLDNNVLANEKIERRVFSPLPDSIPQLSSLMEGQNYINLCNDVDYFQLVQSLYTTDQSYAVTWESYIAGKELLHKKLNQLYAHFPNRIFAYLVPSAGRGIASNSEMLSYMKKYWGHSSYRDIKIYDLQEVEKGQKKIVTISQDRIINDLVEQVERCISGKSFQDVFVTAPTGAGKSLMFQLPAIYIAEKYKLVTLVITPLIGLMNDQVQALARKGYHAARTINSDISPIIKQEILNDVATEKCHILYLSPESLLSRSDIEQLIGTRKIGMLVVDEAHIVTTWGKQFRPDYWYLGDHVQKIRRAQARKELNPSPFIIATFTATAIYEGKEDMYHETINSLHMIDPITYLGYVKRENISIEISEVQERKNKTEYEMNKFDELVDMINSALMRNQKVLIYFPTVALINRFNDYCYSKNLSDYVSKYHGQMDASEKNESFIDFLSGRKLVMLATKAFGMGIDIPDISIVSHFAPTGNVCDYMQEIGRAAREANISGHAIYKHMRNDFKHINRLHGLSAIQKYQLVEVIKKVLEIYTNARYRNGAHPLTKKRNEMLVDAESFAYIFEGPQSDDNDLINKVKTAMLLIQKDYENRGFAPFYMRPIPLFAYGYFAIPPKEQIDLNKCYQSSVKLINRPQNVCEVNLKDIWEKSYSQTMSFPKFKFLLYSRSRELELTQKWHMLSAMSVDVFLYDDGQQRYSEIISAIKEITNISVYQGKYCSLEEMTENVSKSAGISRFRAESIIGVVIAAMDIYQKDYCGRMNAKMYQARTKQDGGVSYQFLPVTGEFFAWLEKGYTFIQDSIQDQKIYVVNEQSYTRCKEVTIILGVLEAIGALRFKSLGGSNSQIYIYVNETKNMQMVRDKPGAYRNKLLELINNRHSESVKMLTYLFQNNFSSNEVWEHLENYFLGILPDCLSSSAPKDSVTLEDDIQDAVLLQVGETLKDDYITWNQVNVLFGESEITRFDDLEIPLADYYAAKLIIGEVEVEADLVWTDEKIAITSGEETEELRHVAAISGWTCIPIGSIQGDVFATHFGR